MRTMSKHVWRVLAPLLLLLCQPATTLSSDFPIGGWSAYHVGLGTGWTFVDTLYKQAGFTAYIGPVSTSNHPIYGIDTLAKNGWMVFGTTELDSVNDVTFEWGPIHNTIEKARMTHWQAELEDSIPLWGRASGTKVRHPKGSTTGDYWYIDSTVGVPDTIAWELIEHLQSQTGNYTALFYMKIETVGTDTDLVDQRQLEIPSTTIRIPVRREAVRLSKFFCEGSLDGHGRAGAETHEIDAEGKDPGHRGRQGRDG